MIWSLYETVAGVAVMVAVAVFELMNAFYDDGYDYGDCDCDGGVFYENDCDVDDDVCCRCCFDAYVVCGVCSCQSFGDDAYACDADVVDDYDYDYDENDDGAYACDACNDISDNSLLPYLRCTVFLAPLVLQTRTFAV